MKILFLFYFYKIVLLILLIGIKCNQIKNLTNKDKNEIVSTFGKGYIWYQQFTPNHRGKRANTPRHSPLNTPEPGPPSPINQPVFNPPQFMQPYLMTMGLFPQQQFNAPIGQQNILLGQHQQFGGQHQQLAGQQFGGQHQQLAGQQFGGQHQQLAGQQFGGQHQQLAGQQFGGQHQQLAGQQFGGQHQQLAGQQFGGQYQQIGQHQQLAGQQFGGLNPQIGQYQQFGGHNPQIGQQQYVQQQHFWQYPQQFNYPQPQQFHYPQHLNYPQLQHLHYPQQQQRIQYQQIQQPLSQQQQQDIRPPHIRAPEIPTIQPAAAAVGAEHVNPNRPNHFRMTSRDQGILTRSFRFHMQDQQNRDDLQEIRNLASIDIRPNTLAKYYKKRENEVRRILNRPKSPQSLLQTPIPRDEAELKNQRERAWEQLRREHYPQLPDSTRLVDREHDYARELNRKIQINQQRFRGQPRQQQLKLTEKQQAYLDELYQRSHAGYAQAVQNFENLPKGTSKGTGRGTTLSYDPMPIPDELAEGFRGLYKYGHLPIQYFYEKYGFHQAIIKKELDKRGVHLYGDGKKGNPEESDDNFNMAKKYLEEHLARRNAGLSPPPPGNARQLPAFVPAAANVQQQQGQQAHHHPPLSPGQELRLQRELYMQHIPPDHPLADFRMPIPVQNQIVQDFRRFRPMDRFHAELGQDLTNLAAVGIRPGVLAAQHNFREDDIRRHLNRPITPARLNALPEPGSPRMEENQRAMAWRHLRNNRYPNLPSPSNFEPMALRGTGRTSPAAGSSQLTMVRGPMANIPHQQAGSGPTTGVRPQQSPPRGGISATQPSPSNLSQTTKRRRTNSASSPSITEASQPKKGRQSPRSPKTPFGRRKKRNAQFG